MKRRNNKGCGGCLAAFLFLVAGVTVAVIGYNTWRGLWLLIGLGLVSVGIALSINFLLRDEEGSWEGNIFYTNSDEDNDSSWWLE